MNTMYAPSPSPGLADRSFNVASRHLEAEREKAKSSTGSTALAWGYGLTVAFALCIGTLAPQPQPRESREGREYRASIQGNAKLESAVAPRTAAEALSYVRTTLKPAVTELASIFGVSRQAIYNWQAGEHISEGNEALLYELAAAADRIVAHPLAGQVNAKRKLPGGRSLFEAVAGGMSGVEAAGKLIAMAEKEGAQRAAMDSRLKNRNRAAVDLASVGSPHLKDRA
jgi:hypothetical protein